MPEDVWSTVFRSNNLQGLSKKEIENSEPVQDLSSLEDYIFSFQDPEWPIRKWWQRACFQRCLLQQWWAASKYLSFLGTHSAQGRCLQLFSPVHSTVLPLLWVKQDNPDILKLSSSHAIEYKTPRHSWRSLFQSNFSENCSCFGTVCFNDVLFPWKYSNKFLCATLIAAKRLNHLLCFLHVWNIYVSI